MDENPGGRLFVNLSVRDLKRSIGRAACHA
jgi:hypothetical protein